MKIENRKLYNQNRFMSIFKPNKPSALSLCFKSCVYVAAATAAATASVMLIEFVVCARFSFFPNAKCKIVSHFPLQPDAACYEKCELKTTFYDETAHRVKYVFIHTKIVRYRLPHFAQLSFR